MTNNFCSDHSRKLGSSCKDFENVQLCVFQNKVQFDYGSAFSTQSLRIHAGPDSKLCFFRYSLGLPDPSLFGLIRILPS
jgi:hypothetical protein